MNFPDSNDRTPNQPCLLLRPTEVLKICNQLLKTDARAMTENMREELQKEALQYGWNGATFLGQQCLLHVEFYGVAKLVFPK